MSMTISNELLDLLGRPLRVGDRVIAIKSRNFGIGTITGIAPRIFPYTVRFETADYEIVGNYIFGGHELERAE